MADTPDDEKPTPQVPPDKPGDDRSQSQPAERDDDGERRSAANKEHPDSF
jgi:hypothetical protein